MPLCPTIDIILREAFFPPQYVHPTSGNKNILRSKVLLPRILPRNFWMVVVRPQVF